MLEHKIQANVSDTILLQTSPLLIAVSGTRRESCPQLALSLRMLNRGAAC